MHEPWLIGVVPKAPQEAILYQEAVCFRYLIHGPWRVLTPDIYNVYLQSVHRSDLCLCQCACSTVHMHAQGCVWCSVRSAASCQLRCEELELQSFQAYALYNKAQSQQASS